MTQVIIYTNENGNVSVCIPTNDLPIEEVLAKDCPEGAIIVDASDLPQEDDDFFNAWRLVDGLVVVDLSAAKNIALHRFNDLANQKATKRALDKAIGIISEISDEDFVADLNAKRVEINAALSINDLRLVLERAK